MAAALLQTFFGVRSAADLRVVITVHVNIVLYAACFWLCQPVLPFLAKELGTSMSMFGYLQTTFSLVQLIGGPLVGRLCDTKGARLAMQISQTGTAISYLLLGTASDVRLLFLSQIPTITMHTMHSAQAFISDFSSDSARAAALGRLSLSYGVGMILGAPIGGYLGDKIGYSSVALLAAAIQFCVVPFNAMILPGGRQLKAAAAAGGNASGGLQLSRIWQVLQSPAILSLVVLQVLLGVALNVYRSTMSMAATTWFNMTSSDLGNLHSIGGILGVFTNVVLVGPLVARTGDIGALHLCVGILSVSLLGVGAIHSFTELIILNIPIGLASSAMYTLNTSIVSKVVSPTEAGTAIGFGHATRSFCGVISPSIAGAVYEYAGFGAVGPFCAALSAIAGAIFYFRSQSQSTAAAAAKRAD